MYKMIRIRAFVLLDRRWSILLATVLVLCAGSEVETADPPPVVFSRDIAPVLRKHCLACHGKTKAEGDYRVDSFAMLKQPGESDEPPFVPGEPQSSEIFRRISSEDESERMPLEGDPLPAELVKKMRQWIGAGAVYDREDPLLPLASIVPPVVHPPPPEHYSRAVPVMGLALIRAADQLQLFVGGYRELLVFDPATGKLLRRIPNFPQRIYSIAPSKDATRLAVAGGNPGRVGDVRILSIESGEVTTVPMTYADVALSVRWSPAGDAIAVAGSDGTVTMISTNELTTNWSRTVHKDWAKDVAFSPDGSQLVSVGFDRQVKLLAKKDGKELAEFTEHQNPVWSVTFARDGKSVFSADKSGRIFRWQVEDGKKIAQMRTNGTAFDLIASTSQLFVAAAGRRVTSFDLNSHKAARQFTGPKGKMISVVLDLEQEIAVSGSDQGEIVVWSTKSGKQTVSWSNAPP